jgi:hypothetical protein
MMLHECMLTDSSFGAGALQGLGCRFVRLDAGFSWLTLPTNAVGTSTVCAPRSVWRLNLFWELYSAASAFLL